MTRDRIPGLPRDTGGSVQVGSPEELAQVLAFEGTDLSSEWITLESALWRPVQDVRERADIYRFLTSATEQVCAAGLLPRPREQLAPFGARVEVMRAGGKPPPPSRYHTGTVNGHTWVSVFRTWHVHVALDQPAGTYCGQPVKGMGTWMWDVQLVGGAERPFSSMTPTEIEELHEQRRKEFWRNIDPATGLTDPSLPRAATPKSSSASRRSCSNSSFAVATPSSSAQIAFIVSTNGSRCASSARAGAHPWTATRARSSRSPDGRRRIPTQGLVLPAARDERRARVLVDERGYSNESARDVLEYVAQLLNR